VATLRAWRKTQTEERMNAGALWQGSPKPSEGFVFTQVNGAPLERRNVVNRAFKPVVRDLRKLQEKARQLHDQGRDLAAIAEALQHAPDRVRRWIEADRLVPEKLRLYDLRHTCATLMLLAGVNPKVASERLGHASVSLTLDTYSHVLPNMQEDATARLAEVVYGD
jgi:integrase